MLAHLKAVVTEIDEVLSWAMHSVFVMMCLLPVLFHYPYPLNISYMSSPNSQSQAGYLFTIDTVCLGYSWHQAEIWMDCLWDAFICPITGHLWVKSHPVLYCWAVAEGRAVSCRGNIALIGFLNTATLFSFLWMFNVSHRPKNGESAGVQVFLSKEQTLEVWQWKGEEFYWDIFWKRSR